MLSESFHDRRAISLHRGVHERMNRPTPKRFPWRHRVPEFRFMEALIIILGALVLIGLIWSALRITIKRDRATIKADMEDPQDIEAYEKRWGKRD